MFSPSLTIGDLPIERFFLSVWPCRNAPIAPRLSALLIDKLPPQFSYRRLEAGGRNQKEVPLSINKSL